MKNFFLLPALVLSMIMLFSSCEENYYGEEKTPESVTIESFKQIETNLRKDFEFEAVYMGNTNINGIIIVSIANEFGSVLHQSEVVLTKENGVIRTGVISGLPEDTYQIMIQSAKNETYEYTINSENSLVIINSVDAKYGNINFISSVVTIDEVQSGDYADFFNETFRFEGAQLELVEQRFVIKNDETPWNLIRNAQIDGDFSYTWFQTRFSNWKRNEVGDLYVSRKDNRDFVYQENTEYYFTGEIYFYPLATDTEVKFYIEHVFIDENNELHVFKTTEETIVAKESANIPEYYIYGNDIDSTVSGFQQAMEIEFEIAHTSELLQQMKIILNPSEDDIDADEIIRSIALYTNGTEIITTDIDQNNSVLNSQNQLIVTLSIGKEFDIDDHEINVYIKLHPLAMNLNDNFEVDTTIVSTFSESGEFSDSDEIEIED